MGNVIFTKDYYVTPQLHKDSLVLFVGQNPGKEEVYDGIPFSPNGKCGEILRWYLVILDEKKISYSITNAVNYYSVNNAAPSKKEGEQCIEELNSAIEYVKPKLIVALGKVALRSLIGENVKILELNGHILDYHIPILVCVHPSYILRQGRSEAIFEKGILPVFSFFDKEKTIEIIDKDTLEPITGEVGFDIETTSLRPNRGRIRCFSVSNGTNSICIRVEDETN